MIKYGLDWIDKNWRPEAFINNFRGPVGPCRGGGGRVYVRNFLFCFVFVFCFFFGNNLYKYNTLSGKVSGLCISLSSRYSYLPFKS